MGRSWFRASRREAKHRLDVADRTPIHEWKRAARETFPGVYRAHMGRRESGIYCKRYRIRCEYIGSEQNQADYPDRCEACIANRGRGATPEDLHRSLKTIIPSARVRELYRGSMAKRRAEQRIWQQRIGGRRVA